MPSALTPHHDPSPRAPVPLRDAALVWVGAWFAGQVVATAIALGSGHSTLSTAGPGWLFAVAAAGWVPLVLAVWMVGKRHGTGSLRADFGFSFTAADLWGVPIGVFTQLVALRVLYLPMEAVWPDTFSQERIEQRARELYDAAHGAGVLLLVLVVVVGAPLVEELVYRGLLQGAAVRATRRWPAVVAVAAFFAVIHFQPVEIPGLFVIGLVLGAAALLTGRLGMSVVAHMAFNATGLLVVALS
jgi:membrane protease YdiL (CAAX protease family)